MTGNDHSFNQQYWEQHWAAGADAGPHLNTANPYLLEAAAHLNAGDALDAGCGAGVEAIWLARHGWKVTGVDISATALATAQAHAQRSAVASPIEWVETDLTLWEPDRQWDFVITNYAHPSIPQLDFYQRIMRWVKTGGTVLIVAHLHDPRSTDQHHPHKASATRQSIVELFDGSSWDIETAQENTRRVETPESNMTLNDVVIQARRIA